MVFMIHCTFQSFLRRMARTTSFWGIFISAQMSRAWLATALCNAAVS